VQGCTIPPVHYIRDLQTATLWNPFMTLFKALIVLVILAGIGWGGWHVFAGQEADGKQQAASDSKRGGGVPVPVSAEAAVRADVPFSLSVVGAVVAEQAVAVRSRIDSQLAEVKFRDGDFVKAGDLLFVLDDRALQAQVKELEANLARDRAQMKNFQTQYERKKSLADRGFETKANLDESKAQYEVQRATISATQASIDNIKVELQYTRIAAPISGRTGTIGVTPGNTVKANDALPLVTINQVSPIRVQAAVAQKYLPRLRAAMAAGEVGVTATIEGSADKSAGHLEYIDNAIDSTTGTFNVRASFANDDEKLWPGMFVNVTINLGDEKGVMTVPEVSIQHGQDGDFIFTIAEGKAQKTPVTVERIQNGIAILKEGAEEGMQVITDGMLRLENGSAVDTTAPAIEPATPPAPAQ
jgi:membrane fusion protein, multidrug efflux system